MSTATAATATTETNKKARSQPIKNQIDYLEIRVEQSESTGLSFRGEKLDSVDRSFFSWWRNTRLS